MISLNLSRKLYFSSKFNILPFSDLSNSIQKTKTLNRIIKDQSCLRQRSIWHRGICTKTSYNFSSNVFKQALNQVLSHPYSRLCRWQKPIGALLLFWPCLWGIEAGASNLLMVQSMIPLYFLFLMGSWTSRSAGCIINDYLDKDFDKNVERCKNRPLASGEVTTAQAAKLLFFNLCGGLIVLTQMNIPALIATFMILPISALYPLAKRYVKHPQAVLASAFNSGVFICGLTVNPLNPAWEVMTPLYLAGICWTMIYDTIYAFQDIDDDKKLGLKSTAIQWEENITVRMNQLLAASLLLTSSLAYFNPAYIYSLPIFIGAHVFLKLELNKIDIGNKQSCGQFFKKNNIFGLLIFAGLLLKRLIDESNSKDNDKQKKLKPVKN